MGLWLGLYPQVSCPLNIDTFLWHANFVHQTTDVYLHILYVS